jgi:predicted nucleotidyltransferase
MATIYIKGQLIAGIPAITIRNALRRARHHDAFTRGFFVEECKVSERKAREIVNVLLKDNFLEIAESPRWERSKRNRWYKLTSEGFKLSNATGLQRMPRAKAEQMLTAFLKRVQEVNHTQEYCYSVDTVIVSGSYARGENTLGDLDIFYGLKPRFRQSEREQARKQRIDIAFKKGRRFSNIVEELYWPEHEIGLHLKSRTRGLSLHGLDEFFKMKKDKKFAYKVLVGDVRIVTARLEANKP